MKDYINFEKLEELSELDDDVQLYQKVIKLQEEAGELAQAFLAYDGSKNASKSGIKIIEGMIEEACDVTNVILDIINKIESEYPDYAPELIREMFDKKLRKWESKIK